MAHIHLYPPDEKHALAYFMRHYPTQNLPNPEPLTDAIGVLSPRMDTRRFHDLHAGSSMLCYDVPLIVAAIRKRLKQRKRALGGRKHPQRFHRRDLAVKLLEADKLPKQLRLLCRLLKQEAPRLIRLVLESQAAYEEDLEMYWRVCHEAVGIAMLNMQTLFVAIRRKTSSPWFALLCLRWALRKGWEAFMGKDRFSREARRWLGEIPITIKQEREIWRVLFLAGQAQEAPPEPFIPLIARWQRGDTPPAPPPNTRLRDWKEGDVSRLTI
jgi:hypothetical protein